ncbi:hypothetical protein N0V83_002325 [Neocucurbitaria cava]|uniref:Zn(2)-C6 fungal-type domain-containing protein n=1 Tax=Neocucurbitaria cava TaxID=798079 RepID=A0A9W8YE97_9PLEO|nr:hypothetical protein N0V83_002325 [Neocucurbitaria cava]
MADPDAPAQKRPRLDSGNPVYNGQFPPPLPPPHIQPTRPASYPTLVQPSSPPRHYPPHSLPPPSQAYPPQGQGYPGPQPSPSLPPSDIRALADPRNIPSPGQRPHGVAGPAPVTLPKDNISSYRAPPTPQPISAPEPQGSRSTSISIDVKPQPPPQGMEHGGHQSPWPMNPEHRPNGSATNGYNHTISPPHSTGPVFHQPPPPPPSQQYGQPVDPYAQSPYMGQYASAAQQIRRKQVRATQACNHCRSRKQKCDEARPCQFCRENNFDCQYKDVPPPKQDRSMMQLQDSVNNISDVLRDFVGEFSTWKQSVESRLPPSRGPEMMSNHASPEAAFAVPMRDPSASRWPTPSQGRAQLRRVNSMKMESPIVPHSNMSPIGAQASTPIKQEAILAAPQQPATPADSVRTDHSRMTDRSPREKSGLQSDHTTPAHKLLSEWQAMNTFYKDVDYLNRLVDSGHDVSDYPMQLEQDRGLIRVWGVGEGQDLNDGAQGPGSPESSNDSDVPSPAPGKEGLWGHPPLDHSSPSTMSGSTPREYQGSEGGLGPDGRPNFHAQTLQDLLKSYLENIHVLHPFMNPSKLHRMVKEFTEQYSPDVRAANARSPAASGLQHQLHQGIKRKRSSSAFGEPYSPKGAIERSLRNAIVLLVLAVGKVCAHKEKLPAPQSDKSPYVNGAWGYTRESPRPNGSFNSDMSEDNRPRNIDILPGMAYFSYATDILGNQQGGNTVAHAQAMILAALYLSQFARVLESWSWINNACRITMVLVKADILAEMSTLPPSNISAHQSDIMYPEGVYEKFPADETEVPEPPEGGDTSMLIYSSQIWLRVILNEAHNALYGANGRSSFDTSNVKEVADHASTHIDILQSWRRVLPPALAWKDEDPPSTDLNIARVRAKYYGGLYMMLRPYLRIASHTIEFPPPAASAAHLSQHNSPAYGDYASTSTNRNVQMVELSEDQRKIIKVACQCIDSAIQSTIAFDRVGASATSPYRDFKSTRTCRLVVTNIFGTLHA